MIRNFLINLVKPVADIRPGERVKTLLMFCYFFLIIALNWMLKPVQKSLYISAFGAEKLKFANMAEGIFLILVVAAYVFVAKRTSRKTFHYGILGFFIASFVSFWLLFRIGVPYLPAFFFLWQASFTITMATAFWTLANDIFNTAEAKRLFGIMISGGSVGGVAGAFTTNQMVKYVATEDILLIAAGLLSLCILVVRQLLRSIPEDQLDAPAQKEDKADTISGGQKSAVKTLFSSKYLMLLAAVVIITKMTSTIVDNQFSGVVDHAIQGKEAMTAFFGKFGMAVNATTFFMQFFATSLFLRYLGVGLSIWFLPVGLGLISILTIFNPILATAVLFRIFDLSGNYSVQQASKEVFYLPISSEVRRRVKPLIDMLCYRGSKLFAGLFMWIGSALFAIPVIKLGWLVLALVPLWLFLAWRMKAAYSNLLREYLLNRKGQKDLGKIRNINDVLVTLHQERDFEKVKAFMAHQSAYTRKLAATAQYAFKKSSGNKDVTERLIKQILEREALTPPSSADSNETLQQKDADFIAGLLKHEIQLDAKEIDASIEKIAEKVLVRISDTLRDPDSSLLVKRQAIRILEYLPKQETVDMILHILGALQDNSVRFILVKSLIKIKTDHPELVISKLLIKSEIAREIVIHEQILKLKNFYKKQGDEDGGKNPVNVTLRAMLDESVERIFQYLSLLYPGEMIKAIHDELISMKTNETIKGHALELLANTMDPDILIMVQKVLEEKRVKNIQDEDICRILSQFVKSQDQWFAIVAHFLISDLDLGKKWPNLAGYEEGQSHPLFME